MRGEDIARLLAAVERIVGLLESILAQLIAKAPPPGAVTLEAGIWGPVLEELPGGLVLELRLTSHGLEMDEGQRVEVNGESYRVARRLQGGPITNGRASIRRIELERIEEDQDGQ